SAAFAGTGTSSGAGTPTPNTILAAPVITLTLRGDLDLGANNLFITGAGTTDIVGNVSSRATSASANNIILTGTGTLILSGQNTFSGYVELPFFATQTGTITQWTPPPGQYVAQPALVFNAAGQPFLPALDAQGVLGWPVVAGQRV